MISRRKLFGFLVAMSVPMVAEAATEQDELPKKTMRLQSVFWAGVGALKILADNHSDPLWADYARATAEDMTKTADEFEEEAVRNSSPLSYKHKGFVRWNMVGGKLQGF